VDGEAEIADHNRPIPTRQPQLLSSLRAFQRADVTLTADCHSSICEAATSRSDARAGRAMASRMLSDSCLPCGGTPT